MWGTPHSLAFFDYDARSHFIDFKQGGNAFVTALLHWKGAQ